MVGVAWLLVGVVVGLAAPAAAQPPPAAAPPAPAPPAPTVTPPTVVHHVDAVYPASALASLEHADVVLTLTVDVDGHVSKVDVAQSSGAPDLDEAAVVAARQWTFTPAMRDGKPVASRIKLPFHFAPPAPPPELVTPPPSKDTQLPQQSAVPRTPSPAASAAPPSAATSAPVAVESTTDVQVRGKLEARAHGSSDYQVTVGELKAVPRANASDALKLAPGFLLTNEG